LAQNGGALRISEVRIRVEMRLGHEVNPCTVRNYLNEWSKGPRGKFDLVSRGRYRVRIT
jgi:hypothetical protein